MTYGVEVHACVEGELDDAWIAAFGLADDAECAYVGEEHVMRDGAEPGLGCWKRW